MSEIPLTQPLQASMTDTISAHTSMKGSAFAATAASEIILSNGVTIHDSEIEAVNAFIKIVDEYATM